MSLCYRDAAVAFVGPDCMINGCGARAAFADLECDGRGVFGALTDANLPLGVIEINNSSDLPGAGESLI